MAIPLIVAGAGLTIALLDRLSAFNETAEQTADDTTFTGYPPQYVASLNSEEEVFHILQIPN